MITRLDLLRKFVRKDAQGLEIAPYFNPIVKKSDGYKVLTLDVFDQATLKMRASADPNIDDAMIDQIESVDIVGSASDLSRQINAHNLEGKLAYIVSSHNFEHLPDPIRFLQSCSLGLSTNGVLAMAIPDYRACFDHYRMPTRLSDWLLAYHQKHQAPSAAMLFDAQSNFADYVFNDKPSITCNLSDANPDYFTLHRNMKRAYASFVTALDSPGEYQDCHCSCLFGELFALLINDLRYLQLIDLRLIGRTPTRGCEFFVYLRKQSSQESLIDEDTFFARRQKLLQSVNSQLGSSAFVKAHTTDQQNTIQ